MSLPTMSSSSVLANCPKCDCICDEEPPGYAKINDSSIEFTPKTNLPAFIINPSVDFPLPRRKCIKLKKSDSENVRELSLANYVCRVLSMLSFPELWFTMLKSKLSILFRYNKKKYQEIMSEKAAFAAGKRNRKKKKFHN